MKLKLLFAALSIFIGLNIQAQDILGFWNGKADVLGQKLRIEFDLKKTESGIGGICRSPDQGNGEMEITDGYFRNDSLFLEVESIRLSFSGKYGADLNNFVGSLNQMGATYPIVLQREPLEASKPKRPQTPKEPYSFDETEIRIPNQLGYELVGNLAIPKGEMNSVVILISGSGPQDRNSDILGHQLFLVWAEELAKHGIGSFRYDERGVGASGGNFNAATSIDLAQDVLDIRNALKKREELKDLPIGLMGHSEGGLIVAICASQDKDIDFVISLAGLGQSGREVLVAQNGDIPLAEGMTEEGARKQQARIESFADIVTSEMDSLAMNEKITQVVRSAEGDSQEVDALIENYIRSMNTPWMREFLKIDARDYWSKVDCPVLAINGTKDTQVEGGANLRAIEFSLRRNKNTKYRMVSLKDHNHLLQETANGAPSLYGKLEQSVSPLAMSVVWEWINELS